MESLFGVVLGALYIAAVLEEILVPTLMLQPLMLLGRGAWAVSGLWIILMVLDLWGKVRLRGAAWPGLVSVLVPPTWSALAALAWSGELHLYQTEAALPQVWSGCILLAVLELWVLVRNLVGTDAQKALERGCGLEAGLCLWPAVLGGLTIFMCTWGLLPALLIGSLLYNDIGYGWDDTLIGITGLLAGWLLVYGFQVLYFWRGLYLSEREGDKGHNGWLWAGMLLPVGNFFLAQRLLGRLRGEELPRFHSPLRPKRRGGPRGEGL